MLLPSFLFPSEQYAQRLFVLAMIPRLIEQNDNPVRDNNTKTKICLKPQSPRNVRFFNRFLPLKRPMKTFILAKNDRQRGSKQLRFGRKKLGVDREKQCFYCTTSITLPVYRYVIASQEHAY